MKTLLLNHSDLNGGAAIAAYRTHRSLKQCDVSSTMWVNRKVSDDWSVESPATNWQSMVYRIKPMIGQAFPKMLYRDTAAQERSFNWLPSRWPRLINSSNADLVHLQWVNSEMISIKNISRIDKPLVMTLQDMWAFCGAEHYTQDERYIDGYAKNSRPDSITGLDIDQFIWKGKKRHWRKPVQIVAISHWLADCAKRSALMHDWPITVIPNPIDTSIWKPSCKKNARLAFNLPLDKKIITFGAIGGTSNPRKGFKFLVEVMSRLSTKRQDVHVVVFGQSEPEIPSDIGFPATYVGRLSDPVAMSMLNSASDVFVNPAIQEAFGQTASEAQACGLPVVAFKNTGIADIVNHRKTGYLADWSDADDLLNGVEWTLDRTGMDNELVGNLSLSENARERAERLFSYDTVGHQYKSLYEQVVNS